MSRNKRFFQVQISHVLRFISICDLVRLSLVDKEGVLKSTSGNNSLHKSSNDNGARVVNFAISKNLSSVQCSHNATLIHSIGHLLMERHGLIEHILLDRR
jgi:hypothetical protein